MDENSAKVLLQRLLGMILTKSGKTNKMMDSMTMADALACAETYINKPNSETLTDSKESDIIDPTKIFMKQDG